jgi:prepilin-type processing-associated H-X9-DG protein
MSPDQLADWVNQNSDYSYVVGDKKMITHLPPASVMAYEKTDYGGGRNFLYLDGHVQWQDTATAEKIIAGLK